jgi:16S rRNA (adenine1518-N6/adenine1519-N6)-dimethyltransferase
VTRLFVVPAGAFSPPPQVQSAIVRLLPRPMTDLPDVDPQRFAQVVAAAFGQRRKTLRNALAALLGESQIRAAGIDPQARGETLTVEDFVALASRFGAP